MDAGIRIETGIPLPRVRTPLGELLAQLPISTGRPTDKNLLIPDRKRGSLANSLSYWQNKLNHKYRTRQDKNDLRVWRIE